MSIAVSLVKRSAPTGRPANLLTYWRYAPGVEILACAGPPLFGYGYAVNGPGWDFRRLLGFDVGFVFVVSQLVSWLAFGQPPSRSVWLGGGLVIAAGQ